MRTANYMHEALKPRRVCTYLHIHCKDMQTSSDPRQLLKKAVCSQGTIPHKQPNGLSLSPPETHLQTHMSPKRAARRPKKLQRRTKVMGNWQSLREGQSPDGRILAESRPMPVQYRGLGQMQATQAIQSKRKGNLTLEHLSCCHPRINREDDIGSGSEQISNGQPNLTTANRSASSDSCPSRPYQKPTRMGPSLPSKDSFWTEPKDATFLVGGL